MRELTLDEMVIVEKALEKRGIPNVKITDNESALHYWYMASSKSLASLLH